MKQTDANDRRVRKTKRALRDGLAELLAQKDINKITVQELTDKVDINRATFYSHYSDIYDLYGQIENSVIEELRDILSDESITTVYDFFKITYDYVYDNRKLCTMLFGDHSDAYFLKRLNEMLEETTTKLWAVEYKPSVNEELFRIFTRYHIQGIMSIVSYWAQTDYKMSEEKLIEISVKLSNDIDNFITRNLT